MASLNNPRLIIQRFCRVKILHVAFGLAAWLSMTAFAAAQPTIDWSTIDGGGATFSTGGPFELGGTIGQPDAQTPPVMTGGPFELTGGFWPVANVCYCLGDMNGDGKKDGRDVQRFTDCIISGGDCACADIDQIGGVELADVTVFVNALLAGTPCP
jgi:hypothetical protein